MFGIDRASHTSRTHFPSHIEQREPRWTLDAFDAVEVGSRIGAISNVGIGAEVVIVVV